VHVRARGGHRGRTTANELDPDEIIARVDSLAARAPDAFAAAGRVDAVNALNSRLPSRLVERISARAAVCRAALLR
jgi:hypothetical protein